MALIDDVKAICARLAPRGWDRLFRDHCGDLDITKPVGKLAEELDRALTGIDRAHPGLDELSPEGRSGVTPGSPARSVLYHALACPTVHPLTAGPPDPADYPTLAELDTIENYVFSRAPRKLSSFRNPVIAVFACQYRLRAHTPHHAHADLAFSRAGVARVGSEAERYDAQRRSFDARPSAGDRGFAAQPARYVAYVAEYGPAGASDALLRPVPQIDGHLTFAMPAHKLFGGKECLLAEDGGQINLPTLQFAEMHVNEKLARIHQVVAGSPGRIVPLPGFDLEAPPFKRTSSDSNDLARLVRVGASVLVQPVANPLARLASQKVDGENEPARFKVPAARAENRFWSSYQFETANGRARPEYANIRLELSRTPGGTWKRRNLNETPEPPPPGVKSFERQLSAGGYETAHVIDNTCDGSVTLKPLTSLPLPILPAYSLVTAVDYFPQVEQVAVAEWLERRQGQPIGLGRIREVFRQGGPEPLSDGRFHVTTRGSTLTPTRATPNSQLADAVTPGRPAFPTEEAANRTATAIVGFAARGQATALEPPTPDPGGSSWLPDAASGVFAPGWDVAEHVIDGRPNYVAYGLGSPFPEDAKLCAALNSFWPAVAPDSSRTYGFAPDGEQLPTAVPLMDDELGRHPEHPRVVAGEVAASMGWDGDQGPFFATVGGKRVVNAMNPMRADLTLSALAGRFGFSGLDALDSDAFLRRIEELLFCHAKVLPAAGVVPGQAWLISAETVPDWAQWSSAVLKRASPTLKGAGFIFAFAIVDRRSQANAGNPPLRLTYRVVHEVEVQLSDKLVFHRTDGGPFGKIAR